MLSPFYCLAFLVVISAVSALDLSLTITSVNGLLATVSPDQASLGVDRAPKLPGRVDIALKSVRELYNNMTETTPTNRFTAFANLDPNVVLPSPMNMSVPSSSPSVVANCQTVMFINNGRTSFTVEACAIPADTTLMYGTEKSQIIAGQLGVSLQLMSWQWTSSLGSYLELTVTVSVPTGRTPSYQPRSSETAAKIGLGNSDAYALFSAKVGNDIENPTDYFAMPSDYPKVVLGSGTSSNMATVVFMIPRTNTNQIVWNAVIEPGTSAAESVISSRMMMMQAVAVLLAALAAARQ